MFKQVVVITKDGLETNESVLSFLTMLERDTMRNAVSLHVNTLPPVSNVQTLFIAIGGDGTMLAAAKQSALYNAPVIGFNMGRLGFLVENTFAFYSPSENTDLISKDFMGKILELIFNRTINWNKGMDGEDNLPYVVEDRMMIRGKVSTTPDGNLDWASDVGPALNEILLSPNTLAAPFEYEIYINGKFVAKHNSSGIMVSTPTGSTAFSMSLGGSIMLPDAHVMQIIPVAAHTLTARPIIVSGEDTVSIDVLPTTRINSVDIIADGKVVKSIPTADPFTLTVSSAEDTVKILHNKHWNFFDTLSKKLGWG